MERRGGSDSRRKTTWNQIFWLSIALVLFAMRFRSFVDRCTLYSGNDITSHRAAQCVSVCLPFLQFCLAFCIRMHDTPEVDIFVDVFDAFATATAVVAAAWCVCISRIRHATHQIHWIEADNLSLHLPAICVWLVSAFGSAISKPFNVEINKSDNGNQRERKEKWNSCQW